MSIKDLSIGAGVPGIINTVIEIPKGSRHKYEYDMGLDLIKLDRVIPSSVIYPTDYGFIPETHAEDGDHLDVLVFINGPTFPGCVVSARPIALAKMSDEKGEDSKIIAVAEKDPHFSSINQLDDLDVAYQNEIQHFFEVYKVLENKPVTFHGWGGISEAHQAILATHEKFKLSHE